MSVSKNKYDDLLKNIGSTIETGRSNALSALNEHILLTYWKIGRHIVEFEQYGSERAEYGSALINNLSKDWSHYVEFLKYIKSKTRFHHPMRERGFTGYRIANIRSLS